jgi:hypothetical protein
MPIENDSGPTEPEIRRALENILASVRFRASKRHSQLLTYLVESAIAHVEVTEKTILSEIFPTYETRRPMDGPQNIVRVTVTGLRKRLDEYYAEDGYKDPVVISVPAREASKQRKRPAGEAYRPIFAYDSHAGQLYKQAQHRLMHFTSNLHLTYAYLDLLETLKSQPPYGPSIAGIAEVMILAEICGLNLPDLNRPYHEYAALLGVEAIKAKKRAWLGYVIKGAYFCCIYEWAAAEKAFKAALTLASADAAKHPFYAAYLMATGDQDSALRAVNIWAEGRLEPFVRTTLALFLYAARRYEEAMRILAEVDLTNRDSHELWYTNLVFACVCLQQELAIPNAADRLMEASAMFEGDLFPGLLVLCLAARGSNAEAQARFDALLEKQSAQPIHAVNLAIASIGMGQNDAAVEFLIAACTGPHPLMAWLNVWPLLDPLRSHPRFKELRKAFHLPA